jgi:uncharacterized membrane protein YfcA
MTLFGIGGGAFIVPAIDIAFLTIPNLSHPPFQVIVLGSLATIVMGSLPNAFLVVRNLKKQREIALLLTLSALPFIIGGSNLAVAISDKFLRIGFSAMIILIGLWTLLGRTQSQTFDEIPKKNLNIKIFIAGSLSGVSSVLFGLGGATLLMPLLTIWMKMPIAIAVEISILFVFISSLFSLTSLSTLWVLHHGTEILDYRILLMIFILGLSAAVTQLILAKRIKKMNNALRQKLLGFYLISLGVWVIYQAYQ